MIIHIIINFDALRTKNSTPGIKKGSIRYRQFLFGIMAFYITDFLWGFLYEKRMIALTYIDTVGFFVSMVMSVLLWTRFVVAFIENRGTFGKILIGSGWTIFAFQIIALVINIFTPFFFGFDSNKEYVPGQARFITLMMQMVLYLITSVYTLFVAVKTEGVTKAHHRTIGFSGFVMMVFILLQSLFPLMPFYSIGCLLATCMIHSFVYKDETIEHNLEMKAANQRAFRDGLTGIRNKMAYLETLKDIETRIDNGSLTEYGIVVFDLNDLKKVNDTLGHEAGDEYIRSGCRLICHHFKHSPVFRIGGDEFVAILMGNDYNERRSLVESFEQLIDSNKGRGLVVISSGMDIYIPDSDDNYNAVFKRADKKMYERKQLLKQS
ncbi:MAG: GGDEF domain-containing protein [Clostridiales bacterium]|nr:GGDEF domain-containing protein [Clostridiales bacterium]